MLANDDRDSIRLRRAPGLLARLTGDEKHDPSAYSTLDVLWVLYDRVLVDPPTDARATASCSRRVTARRPTTRCWRRKGFFPAEWLDDFGAFDSPLGYHPDRELVPGVEISSGSLGHGLPIAVGVALLRGAARLRPRRRRRARRGQQPGGDPVRRPRRARPADGRRGRQLVGHPRVARRDRGALRVEGWTAERADGRDHAALERAFRAGTAGRPHLVVAEIRR